MATCMGKTMTAGKASYYQRLMHINTKYSQTEEQRNFTNRTHPNSQRGETD